ncbi:hypothetical protein [Achromobacter sp. SLBN-14]|uniref:hypothetical protein n=1 Tax=Achromobacter TaxID=222 RepID=UPI001167CE2C|nr:hypothetical protein [Achromobacter sp. SLBN-14]TQJ96369.1 hypothetical protein FBY20_3148 [Achromobacter sp. SLBN-14]
MGLRSIPSNRMVAVGAAAAAAICMVAPVYADATLDKSSQKAQRGEFEAAPPESAKP